MAEVFQTVLGQNAPPSYRKYDRVEFYTAEDGSQRLRGVEYRGEVEVFRQLKLGKFIAGYQNKEEGPQKPSEAVWHREDAEDMDVKIIGSFGIPKKFINEDKSYQYELMEAEGRSEGVPRGQLEWKKIKREDDEIAPDDDPEKNQLQRDLDDLRAQMEAMRRDMEERDRQHAQELKDLEDRLEKRHKSEMDALKTKHDEELQSLRDELSGGGIDPDEHDKLKTENEERKDLIDNLNGQLTDRDGQIEDLKEKLAERDRQIDRLNEGQDFGSQPWYGRFGHRIRQRLPGRFGARRVYSVEERETEQSYDRWTGGAVMLGVAALAAAGLAYLWGEHEEHEGRNPAPTLIAPGPHRVNDPTVGVGHRHQVLFHGGRAFKVSLPGNLEWHRNSDGSYKIDDSNGINIVPHVYWAENGRLDKDTIRLLKTTPYHNFSVKRQEYPYHTPGTNYDTHYESVVLNA